MSVQCQLDHSGSVRALNDEDMTIIPRLQVCLSVYVLCDCSMTSIHFPKTNGTRPPMVVTSLSMKNGIWLNSYPAYSTLRQGSTPNTCVPVALDTLVLMPPLPVDGVWTLSGVGSTADDTVGGSAGDAAVDGAADGSVRIVKGKLVSLARDKDRSEGERR
jgi:hypothetical protein